MRHIIAFAVYCSLSAACGVSARMTQTTPKTTSNSRCVNPTQKMKTSSAATIAAASILIGAADPANAAAAGKGQKLFEANCAECHAAGKKLGAKEMSLQKDALIKGPGLDQQAIENYLKEEFPHKYMPFKFVKIYSKLSFMKEAR